VAGVLDARYHYLVEAKKQIEIQLGHMCNNRCVFCFSGQATHLGNAGPLDLRPQMAEMDKARAAGHTKVTILGGEPTLQPGFLDVVRHGVALGFEEIVIFTNGAKTAREAFIDEILATAGDRKGLFTWRISIQGATEEAHERTTMKDGSFARILRTMEILHRKGERITVNMCVVSSNYESVDAFPALLAPFGVRQLHLDMVRPLDAGTRTEEEFRAMIPRYSDMVPVLERMARGFPEGFDLNIGNVPYCLGPQLARFIHHGGNDTSTFTVDELRPLSRPLDKYNWQARDKSKPERCGTCVFDTRCRGVSDHYRALHGTDELVPVTREKLNEVDPGGDLFSPPAPTCERVARSIDTRLARLRRGAPYGALVWREVVVSDGGGRAEAVFDGPAGERATVWMTETKGRVAGGYRVDAGSPTPALVEGLRAVVDVLRMRPGEVVT
jgi:MoaA/NifB/PqqE/SkfB family radical SAM enzyme